MKVLVTVLGRPPSKYIQVHWQVGQKIYNLFGPPARALVEHEQIDQALLLIPDSLVQHEREADEWAANLGFPFQPLVLPSRYTPTVEGNVLDFYYTALFRFVDWFRSYHLESERPLTLILEASTGLNVLQLLLYRAVLDFAQALAYTREVELKVYTADPVTPQMAGRVVALHLTESRPVPPALPRLGLKPDPKLLSPERVAAQDKEFREKKKQLGAYWPWDEVRAFLGAVYQGIPLGILTWCPTQEKASEAWQVLHGLYSYAYQKTESQDGKHKRLLAWTEWWRAYSLGMLLHLELYQHFHPVLQRWERCQLATLQDLEQVVARLYRDIPVLLNRFKSEQSLRIEVEDRTLPALLSELQQSQSPVRKDSERPGPDMRNFFAHMGFERHTVEVDKLPDGQSGFRYHERHRKTIARILSKSI